VFDHDARRIADLVREFNHRFGIDDSKSKDLEDRVARSLVEKQSGESDSPEVLLIKSLIRWSEAKAGAIVAGCREEHLHFLDLPFYRTGTIAKKPLTDEDIGIVRKLIDEVQPAQIYVAGDLSDPHGTHRVCAEAILRAVDEIDERSRPAVLLYRGAWQEWAPHEIDVAVPLSPRDLELKRAAIFRHESQKDSAQFPGPDDPREFWQRAEDRNRHTADVYNKFGLPEYYALEGFVRWNGVPI
jgi:glucosamine-6-phosphate deaminase